MLKQPETMGYLMKGKKKKNNQHKIEVLPSGNLLDKHLVMVPWKDSTLHSC